MYFIKFIACLFLFSCSLLYSGEFAEFTVSSYNCGGLTDHYDYKRAAVMQKIMQLRHNSEPEEMALNETIQKLALKILFAPNDEKRAAQQEWRKKGYENIIRHLASSPKVESPNKIWAVRVTDSITAYKDRPVEIHDEEVKQLLADHIVNLSHGKLKGAIGEIRTVMAKRIFVNELKHDIICLQEADYLNSSMFPSNYTLMLDDNAKKSINGIAFNTERFALENEIGGCHRFYALQLRDLITDKIITVASGHLSGCNPYHAHFDPNTDVVDSSRGDKELQYGIDAIEDFRTDLMVIGMDSNVTSIHPRMEILKNANYILDYENYLEPTCANPHQVLNTRIDWIAIKDFKGKAKIANTPVLNVNLNCVYTNMSDHKPVAAKISYKVEFDKEYSEESCDNTIDGSGEVWDEAMDNSE
ncbi:MAG: hypothetical protein H0W50_04330 [Parachlamydiaceae bacterium]|nr:hypothetical protein [Parachlamydiaceae bacterium]